MLIANIIKEVQSINQDFDRGSIFLDRYVGVKKKYIHQILKDYFEID